MRRPDHLVARMPATPPKGWDYGQPTWDDLVARYDDCVGLAAYYRRLDRATYDPDARFDLQEFLDLSGDLVGRRDAVSDFAWLKGCPWPM